jgi:hypothetical protein
MRSRSKYSRIKGLIIIAGAMTLMASCSSGGSGNSAAAGGGTPAAGPAAAGSTATGAAAAGGGGSASATCTQVTASQVQALLVNTITKTSSSSVHDQVTLDGMAQQCTFATSDTSAAITLTVVGGADAGGFYTSQAQGITAVSVPGIGDKAVRDGDHGSTAVISEKSGVACLVDTSDAGQVPGVGNLEEAAGDTSDIGDGNYAALAAAMGTLCNRVFGSGNTTPDLSGLIAAGASASASAAANGSS